MLSALILFACMVLLVFVLGLPLLLRPDSPIPDIIAFCLLVAMVAAFIWGTGAWWILLPILALVALTVRLDRPAPAADLPEAGAGMSRPVRLRFRLWRWAIGASFALTISVFVLPAVGQGRAVTGVVVPLMMVAMTAMALFRFAFTRACRREADGSPRGDDSSTATRPAAVDGGVPARERRSRVGAGHASRRPRSPRMIRRGGGDFMLVHIFRGEGRVFGVTTDEAGGNLPAGPGPWTAFRSIDLVRGQAQPGLHVDECLDDLERHGLHVTDAHVRITDRFLKSP